MSTKNPVIDLAGPRLTTNTVSQPNTARVQFQPYIRHHATICPYFIVAKSLDYNLIVLCLLLTILSSLFVTVDCVNCYSYFIVAK